MSSVKTWGLPKNSPNQTDKIKYELYMKWNSIEDILNKAFALLRKTLTEYIFDWLLSCKKVNINNA